MNTSTMRVYVDMVGDLFHYGHVEALKRAREMGDYLIVGVHADNVCASYKRSPVMNMKERIAVIEACRYVDEVIAEAPLVITADYISRHRIEKVCHAHDPSEHEKYAWMYAVPSELGIFHRLPYTRSISTTDIIHRLRDI